VSQNSGAVDTHGVGANDGAVANDGVWTNNGAGNNNGGTVDGSAASSDAITYIWIDARDAPADQPCYRFQLSARVP